MTIEERLRILEERLKEQVLQRDHTRVMLEQMNDAVQQLHGACGVLREIKAEAEKEAES